MMITVVKNEKKKKKKRKKNIPVLQDSILGQLHCI